MLTLLCAFHGRHEKVERIIRCFINQDYTGEVELLLYNNSNVSQTLDYEQIMPLLSENKNIRLVNNHIDLQTKEPYTNVGDIFRDALTFVDKDTIVINFFDSDDIFLPNHAREGMLGFTEGTKNPKNVGPNTKAYKPYYSYYVHGDNKIELSNNNMEPSIFLYFQYVEQLGFSKTPASYHQQWLTPIQRAGCVYEPKDGVPTFIYDWGKGHNTHKISGLGDSIDNFEAHRQYECDFGDGILSACSPEIVEKYYDLALNMVNV
jgi:hypothetical protein